MHCKKVLNECDSNSNVWRVLASLVTEGLQLRASNIIPGSLSAVDLASLVLAAYVMCELCALFGCSTQHKRTVVGG